MGAYDDMIDLPRPTSTKHPRMPMSDRAAQFSPFAALVGHGAAIEETARLTDRKVELAEDEKAVLNEKLRLLLETDGEGTFTWFLPDRKKEGGAYIDTTGRIKKIDPLAGRIVLMDGTVIPVEDVLEIEITAIRRGPAAAGLTSEDGIPLSPAN